MTTEVANITALGWMTNEEISRISWFLSFSDKKKLKRKVIVDVGAWISGFLEFLNPDSTKLFEIDPIYAEEEVFESSKQSTLEFTEYVLELLTTKYEFSPEVSAEIEDRKRKKNKILSAKYSSSTNITRLGDIKELKKKADIIFISSLLYAIEDPLSFLTTVSSYTSISWKVYIIDSCEEGIGEFLLGSISNFQWVSVNIEGSKVCFCIEKKSMRKVLWVIRKNYRRRRS